jgi:hypothetical protein
MILQPGCRRTQRCHRLPGALVPADALGHVGKLVALLRVRDVGEVRAHGLDELGPDGFPVFGW